MEAYQTFSIFNLKDFWRHPVWPLLLAALIAGVGGDYMNQKFIGIIFCLLWLLFEAWLWSQGAAELLLNRGEYYVIKRGKPKIDETKMDEVKSRREAFLRFWRATITSISGCAVSILALWMAGHIALIHQQEEQVKADRGILIGFHVPPSMKLGDFTAIVTNQSGVNIDRHQISCFIKDSTYNTGRPALSNLALTMDSYNGTLVGNGDSQSDKCLRYIRLIPSASCIDMLVTFNYELDSQREKFYSKSERFVYTVNSTDFSIDKQPLNDPRYFCNEKYP
jgi:hypothetical protein